MKESLLKQMIKIQINHLQTQYKLLQLQKKHVKLQDEYIKTLREQKSLLTYIRDNKIPIPPEVLWPN